ncbi:hypothetical protein ACIQPS_36630 [Streptomyces sp. NPDC091290]|uniref:hypothetical protein n=1 Tax=Streptomyces sp. NPDC091290 TaxID=3365990 RepID=UPI003802BAC3
MGQAAECVVTERTQTAFIGLVEGLGFEHGHIDAGRAVVGALTAQAKIEGLVDLGGLSIVPDDATIEHLLECPRTTSGGVLLISGGGVRGAHEPALSAEVGSTFAHPDATMDAVSDVTAIVREGEPSVASS